MIDPRIEDWRDFANLPWNEYKHLERDKFEELLDMLTESYPDHEITEWFRRGFCMNDGDSCVTFASLKGRTILNHHLSHFDEEDADVYRKWYGNEDDTDLDWDDEWV